MIRERVAAAIVAGGGVKVMVEKTGIPLGTLNKYAAKSSTASFGNAARISAAAGIGLDEIAFGEDPYPKRNLRRIMDDMRLLSEKRSENLRSDDMVLLPTYSEVEASAGLGNAPVSDQADGVISLSPRFLRDQGAVPEKCVVIWARGDSMMPTIPDGSALIVDHSQTEIRNGLIMVLNVDGDLLVKRIRRSIAGGIELISDNPAYKPEPIPPALLPQLRVVGRVVYFCRTP